ncbi:unnamed protein product, partial [Cuscuta epithymum]
MLQWDELAEAPNSNCAQAIHSRPQADISNWGPGISAGEHRDEKDGHGTASMGKYLQIGVARTPDLQLSGENGSKDFNKLLIGKLEELNTAELKGKNNTDIDVSTGPSKEIGTTKDMPSLELSLKQHREVVDAGAALQERNVLRHSDQSAFSRYGGGTTTTSTSANPQATAGNVGSCSPVNDDDDDNYNNNNSSVGAKAGSMNNLKSMPNQRSSGGSNNIDMGSSTGKSLAQPSKIPFGKVDSVAQAALVQSRVLMQQQQVQVQHHYHHYHHHHHHVHSQQQNGSLPVRENGVDDPNGMLGDEENYTSASWSNNGSNGQNESNAGVVGDETNNNMDSEDDEMGAKCTAEGGDGSGSGSRSGVMDQSRQMQRDAALYKFRQKRKERNFDKKVRYQSRKRSAEQRP